MRKYIAAILLLLLCGCRATEKQLDMPPSAIAELVGDAVGVMLDAYPPARTRLSLQLEATDAFGIAFLDTLRINGYAVAEPDKVGRNGNSESSASLGFAYSLDIGKADGEAKLILHVGTESLNRLYAVQETDGGPVFTPQSAWSRKQ